MFALSVYTVISFQKATALLCLYVGSQLRLELVLQWLAVLSSGSLLT